VERRFIELERIARDSLRACYLDEKVIASPTHFSDFWARDTFFAVPGMLAIGDQDRVKVCLEYFLSLQRSDGKIPRKISRDLTVIKYLLGKSVRRKKLKPTYHGLVRPFDTMDSELLLVIAVGHYLEKTRDYDFAEKYYSHFRKAIDWHVQSAKKSVRYQGFVHEYFLGNWMDTVFKFGPVLYTNVLYAKALGAMVSIAQIAGHDDESEVYVRRAMKVKRMIRTDFWNGTYFCDELRLKNRTTFDLAGNVLAVLYDVADSPQKQSITETLLVEYKLKNVCMRSVPSGHMWWKINPVVRCMGIADYHTQTSWLWITALVAQVFHENDHEQHRDKLLMLIEAIALRDGEIGETYGADSNPYRRLLWRSASPFAWSSGVILHVLERCGYTTAAPYDKPEQRIC